MADYLLIYNDTDPCKTVIIRQSKLETAYFGLHDAIKNKRPVDPVNKETFGTFMSFGFSDRPIGVVVDREIDEDGLKVKVLLNRI